MAPKPLGVKTLQISPDGSGQSRVSPSSFPQKNDPWGTLQNPLLIFYCVIRNHDDRIFPSTPLRKLFEGGFRITLCFDSHLPQAAENSGGQIGGKKNFHS